MGAVIARWAFAAVYLVSAVIAIWGGLLAINPPAPEPSQFNPNPLGPPVNPQMQVTAAFYFLSAAVFLAATAYAVMRILRKDGLALVSGLNAAFAGILILVGAYLVFLGGFLAFGLGGSWYYLLTGLATLAIAALMLMRNPLSAKVYAVILAVTIPWAFWESGLEFLGLLSRLGAWIVVGLWFLSPWYRSAMRASAEAEVPRGSGRWVGFAQIAGVLVLTLAGLQGYSVVEGTNNNVAGNGVTDWRNYGGVSQGQRFVQLDQINVENVGQLKEAWRFRTRVPYDNKNTPLMVNDVVYTCTAGNTVIALDADSGSELWRHDSQTVVPGRGLENASTFARTCRSLGYYEAPADYAGECPKRILMGTVDARLLAIDATNGEPCRNFGFDGVVNLKSGLGPHQPGQSMNTSGPLIAGDIAVVGGWVTDNQQLGNVSGVIRAYNVLTGAFAWAWDMGNPGYHGLPDEGGEYTRGTPNVWSLMSYDPELNLLYAPTGNSSPDYFDGELRSEAAETFASAVVAIDAATGEPRWQYQTVHRDIWDWDVPSQPVLVNVRKNGEGEPIPAVAQPTKRGEIFLLDRRDGTPIYPIEERPVPQNPEVGETVTATQPFSPLPHFRDDRWEDDMWGLTPLDHLWCRVEFKKMRYEGHFTPPMRGGGGQGEAVGTWGGTFQYPGNAGGFNWGSVSVDADNGLLVGAPMLMGNRIVLRSLEDRAKLAEFNAERRRQAAARRGEQPGQGGPGGPGGGGGGGGAGGGGGGGGGAAARPEFDPQRVLYTAGTSPFMSLWRLPLPFLNVGTELPCFEPPYGMIGVIDLNQNKLLWKRPFGSMRNSGPFGIETGLPFMVGTPLQSGSITTRGGLIFHGGAMDSTLRAFDLRTGKVKWEAELPGSAHATPMSYMSSKSGKQYVLITVPNPSWSYPRPPQSEDPTDDQGGYVIAYALPDAPAQ